jgi:hypothetical protein
MRHAVLSAFAAAFALVPVSISAQPAASNAASDQSATATPAPAGKPQTGKRLLTPEQEGRQGIVKGVAVQPFRDLNLVRSKIPPVLREAIDDAYAKPGPGCPPIQAEMKRLDDALGPDLDMPVSTDHPGLVARGSSAAKNASYDAMRSAEQDYIPFDGFIRMLSGADRHDHLVLAAIQAGAIRRGYLKGLGEMRGCTPPSVPRHLAHPVTVAEEAKPK